MSVLRVEREQPLMAKVTASAVAQLLLARHQDDVWAQEIAIVPGNKRRIDFWAMTKSHSNLLTQGYEIKVSRGDFMGDNKWMDYLAACNRLYLVCPYGMVAPEEIMPEAGLIWVTKNGSKLLTKKKAQYRTDGVDPTFVYRQLLMRLSTPLDQRRFEDPCTIQRIQADQELLGKWLAAHVKNHRADKELELAKRESKLRKYEPLIEVINALGFEEDELSRVRWFAGGTGDPVTGDDFARAYQVFMDRVAPMVADGQLVQDAKQVIQAAEDLIRTQKKLHNLKALMSNPGGSWVERSARKEMDELFDRYRDVCARCSAGIASDQDLDQYKILRDRLTEIRNKGN